MNIQIERTAADRLSCKKYHFYVFDRNDSIHVRLNAYEEFQRPTTRHKFVKKGIYQGNNFASHNRLPKPAVPEDVAVEVKFKVINSITLTDET
jgi:hypothetical protein